MNPYNESRFEGSVIEFIFYCIVCAAINIFTLGIGFPWADVIFQRWICENTVIDGKRLQFDGTGAQLFGNYIKWWFFTVITLGIYGFWVFNKITHWRTKHTHFID